MHWTSVINSCDWWCMSVMVACPCCSFNVQSDIFISAMYGEVGTVYCQMSNQLVPVRHIVKLSHSLLRWSLDLGYKMIGIHFYQLPMCVFFL